MDTSEKVSFTYKNHRGETSKRTVTPHDIIYSATKWHIEMQWLLEGYCHDRKDKRFFAMRNITNWKAITPAIT